MEGSSLRRQTVCSLPHRGLSGMPEDRFLGGHLVEGAIVCSTGEFVLAELERIAMLRTVNEETKEFELNPRRSE